LVTQCCWCTMTEDNIPTWVSRVSLKLPPFWPSNLQISIMVYISWMIRPVTSGDECLGLQPSCLFFSSGLCFLVDTVAEVSVIPPSHTDHKHSQDYFNLMYKSNNYNNDLRLPITDSRFRVTMNILMDFCGCRCPKSNSGCWFLV